MRTTTKLEVIIEKDDGVLWARIEDKGDFLPATQAKTTKGVLQNLRTLIKGYQKHEGKKDTFWKKVNADTVEFNLLYDVQAFFEAHDYLKQSKIAELAKINPGLLRQYASGVKYPSPDQAKKIEDAIHKLAKELQAVSLWAA